MISGPPASGKSSIAEPLAQALGFALLSKDSIKEALFDSLRGPAGDGAYSKRLSDAAMDVLFALATRCPRAVLDANFKPLDLRQRERLAALGDTIVEVHCRCDPDELIRRYAQRADSRHPGHALKYLTPELIARHDRPMGLGTVIEVDTNAPVDFPALLRLFLRRHVMANKLASSVAKIVEILSPLDAEDRVRVVNASLTLFGEAATPRTPLGQMQAVSTPSGAGNVDQLGISNQASAWLSRNGLSKGDLEAWYHFEQGAVTLLALPGSTSTHSQQAVNTYLLVGFAAFLASGDTSFSDGDARERCQHFGCYDSTNHAKIYRTFGNKITGSKSTGWKLTVPGLNAAGALLKGSSPA